MFKDKRDTFFLIAIIFIQLLFFGVTFINKSYYLFFGSNFNISDSFQYLTEAKNIAEKGIFYCGDLNLPIKLKYYSLRPPIYPLFLAIFYYFKSPILLTILFQNLISLFSILLVRNTLLHFNYKKKYDLFFIILLVLTPSQFIYANTIFSEILFQFFIVLMFRYILFFHKFKNPKFIFYYSFALILAAYTKPVMYLFVIPNLFYMIYVSIKIKKWFTTTISIIPICAILLIFIWNHKRTNHYEYSSIQTINLLDYNTRLFLLKDEGFTKTEKTLDSIHLKANSITDYSKRELFLDNASKNILQKRWFSYLFYHLQGSFYAILDPGRFDISNFFLIKTTNVNQKGILFHINNGGIKSVIKFLYKTYSIPLLLLLGLILIFNLFKLFYLILFIFNPKTAYHLKVITIGLILYITLLAGPVGASRYLMPLVPIIIGVVLIDNYFINLLFKKLNNSK